MKKKFLDIDAFMKNLKAENIHIDGIQCYEGSTIENYRGLYLLPDSYIEPYIVELEVEETYRIVNKDNN